VIPGRTYTPQDFASILWRRKWLLVVPLVVCSVATFFAVRTLPNRYKSETLILVVPQRVPESYVKSTVTARIEDRLQTISQQILSRTRLERIVQDFDLYAKERRTGIMEDVVEKMRRDIDILVIKGDSFRITFTGDEPRKVMDVTQRLASLFIDENLRDREMLAQGSYQFLESQLDGARGRLIEHEKKLEEYRRRYAGELPTQLQSNLQVIQNTQMQIQALTESLARDRDRRLMLERAIADSSSPEATAVAAAMAPAPAAPGDPLVGTAVQQLESARQTLRQLELRLKPEHPDVVRMKRTIANLEQKADTEAALRVLIPNAPSTVAIAPAEVSRQNRLKELKTEVDNLDRQLARKEEDERQLRKVVVGYQGRIEGTPARESDLTELMRDYDTLQKSYTTLLTKREDSKVSADLERNQIGEQFKVLDVARMPEKPDSPNREKIDLIGAVIGLAIGFGLIGLLEFSDSTLKSDDDVMTALKLPVLAMVPVLAESTPRKAFAMHRWRLMAIASALTMIAAMGLLVWKFRLPGLGI
jgi:polysaccharide chain length determinant protein (PEP-CTERM system associated)